MYNDIKYRFFRWLSQWADRNADDAYVDNNGMNSACPRCKKWEHQGNRIKTEIFDESTEKRSCPNCGHSWRTIFTPVGFIPLDEFED